MARVGEFISFVEYNDAVKAHNILSVKAQSSQTEEDLNASIEANKKAVILRQKIKRLYNLDEISFKIWLSANKEFIRTLTKVERETLIKLEKAYNYALENDDNVGTEELQKLLTALANMNYSEFIDQYLEDYQI